MLIYSITYYPYQNLHALVIEYGGSECKQRDRHVLDSICQQFYSDETKRIINKIY